MPVVDVNMDELRTLTGHDKSAAEFKHDLFQLGLEFEGETADGELQFEFGPDRLDRLSVEGIARSLRYQYGDSRGVAIPSRNDPEWTIEVDESVPDQRPYVTGVVARGVDLDTAALESLIQLQEKLHATMGRDRAKGAIGIHDLAMLKGAAYSDGGGKSVTYQGVNPEGDTFVPLEADAELTPAAVLETHETGRKYAELVSQYDRYPAIYDDIGLFSFPPVINGARTEVTTGSRELFIEMTGTRQSTIDGMLNVVCYALAARGATLEEVTVVYDDDTTTATRNDELVRPDFTTDAKHVTHGRIESVLGVSLETDEVVDLFERSGLDATYGLGEEVTYEVEIPPYRVDVLHPLDLIDDVGRAYGFNELEATYPDVGTVGGRHERSRVEDAARSQLIGLGFEDLLNFHMISAEHNYERMRLDPDDGADVVGGGEAVDITEPYSDAYTQLRSWALPSLMAVLERNTHRAYPQDLAEIGLAAQTADSPTTNVAEHQTVAAVMARYDATYEDAKARLQALCRDFDVTLETPPTEHPSFIPGRVASVAIDGVDVGVIGEIHPAVLVEHDLELPVAAFEFRLSALE
ncbi:MAG: phenylalanyl-tRNA synthetase beta subunit [uncultured archaeon A07HR60]|nr:MAG: phenylalanyl-tRNA synthetase beta subunit [uncultured archaeon A07HR60]